MIQQIEVICSEEWPCICEDGVLLRKDGVGEECDICEGQGSFSCDHKNTFQVQYDPSKQARELTPSDITLNREPICKSCGMELNVSRMIDSLLTTKKESSSD